MPLIYLSERERLDHNNACNRYLTPLNNLREGMHEQEISRYSPVIRPPETGLGQDTVEESEDNWVIQELES